MSSSPSTKTVKKTPYKYDDWYNDMASGFSGVLNGAGGNPGLFDLMGSGNAQYAKQTKGFDNLYADAMSGYRNLADGNLSQPRMDVINKNMNDMLKNTLGTSLSGWADRGVMGGTTVSDGLGEIGKQATDMWYRNYAQALADERAGYDSLLKGYSWGTDEALKPYSTLGPIAEAFYRIHGDYYNDPQDTVVSGGK